jgi:hypothetical protein
LMWKYSTWPAVAENVYTRFAPGLGIANETCVPNPRAACFVGGTSRTHVSFGPTSGDVSAPTVSVYGPPRVRG